MTDTQINICARPTREAAPAGAPPPLTPFAVEQGGSSCWICAPSERVARAVATDRALRLELGGALVIAAVPMALVDGQP